MQFAPPATGADNSAKVTSADDVSADVHGKWAEMGGKEAAAGAVEGKETLQRGAKKRKASGSGAKATAAAAAAAALPIMPSDSREAQAARRLETDQYIADTLLLDVDMEVPSYTNPRPLPLSPPPFPPQSSPHCSWAFREVAMLAARAVPSKQPQHNKHCNLFSEVAFISRPHTCFVHHSTTEICVDLPLDPSDHCETQ